MVSRTPQQTETNVNARQGDGNQITSKDAQGPGSPRKQKEPSTPKPAQDAELKDYVGFSVWQVGLSVCQGLMVHSNWVTA